MSIFCKRDPEGYCDFCYTIGINSRDRNMETLDLFDRILGILEENLLPKKDDNT